MEPNPSYPGTPSFKLISKGVTSPIVVTSTVQCTAPLRLFTDDEHIKSFNPSESVIGLSIDPNKVLRSDCTILSMHEEALGMVLEVLDRGWEDLNRRIMPRYLIRLPFDIEAAEGETSRSCSGISSDLSMGGARIYSDHVPEIGQIVKLQTELGSLGTFEATGLVAHRLDGAYGVQFVDLHHNSSILLSNYLSGAR